MSQFGGQLAPGAAVFLLEVVAAVHELCDQHVEDASLAQNVAVLLVELDEPRQRIQRLLKEERFVAAAGDSKKLRQSHVNTRAYTRSRLRRSRLQPSHKWHRGAPPPH